MMSDVCIPQSPVSPGPHVAVLIVFHANVEHTLSSIGSALRLDYPSLEVVAVDDGSVDGSASSVRAAYPSVRILRGDGTLWCNGGFNLGLRDCFRRGIDYVLLMNNDNVISSMALRFLMETERKHHPCVVGSVVADAAERQIVTYAGKTMNWRIGQAVSLMAGKDLSSVPPGTIEADTMGFQGVLIPRQVFDRVGLIDNRAFKHYFGDTDFYLRAAKAGFPIIIDCRSIVWEDVATKGRNGPEESLWRFFVNLASVRSTAHVPSRCRFYRRHAPQYWLATLARFYRDLVRAQAATMLKRHLRRLQGDNGPLERLLRDYFAWRH